MSPRHVDSHVRQAAFFSAFGDGSLDLLQIASELDQCAKQGQLHQSSNQAPISETMQPERSLVDMAEPLSELSHVQDEDQDRNTCELEDLSSLQQVNVVTEDVILASGGSGEKLSDEDLQNAYEDFESTSGIMSFDQSGSRWSPKEILEAYDVRIDLLGNETLRLLCDRGWLECCPDIAGKWKTSTEKYDIEKAGQVYKLVLQRSDQGEAVRWRLLLPCPDGAFRCWGGTYVEPWAVELTTNFASGGNTIRIRGMVSEKQVWEVEAWPESEKCAINLVALRRLGFALNGMKDSLLWFDKLDQDNHGSLTGILMKAEIIPALQGCGFDFDEDSISRDEFKKNGGMRDRLLEHVKIHRA